MNEEVAMRAARAIDEVTRGFKSLNKMLEYHAQIIDRAITAAINETVDDNLKFIADKAQEFNELAAKNKELVGALEVFADDPEIEYGKREYAIETLAKNKEQS